MGIAIKVGIKKLVLAWKLDRFLEMVKRIDFDILQIEDAYLRKLADLPLIHKDPLDRLIISTALSEDLTIITADEDIHKYDAPWIW